ncbi:MAG: hypothetical protein HZC55_21015 [Verrucomicrobia bacterium]|nr:hypothetical protein [Verrucomicrobiota bacterium]
MSSTESPGGALLPPELLREIKVATAAARRTELAAKRAKARLKQAKKAHKQARKTAKRARKALKALLATRDELSPDPADAKGRRPRKLVPRARRTAPPEVSVPPPDLPPVAPLTSPGAAAPPSGEPVG